jgi:hypothetical protein
MVVSFLELPPRRRRRNQSGSEGLAVNPNTGVALLRGEGAGRGLTDNPLALDSASPALVVVLEGNQENRKEGVASCRKWGLGGQCVAVVDS